MENYYQPEINIIGCKLVAEWLNENGYVDVTKVQLQFNEYGFTANGRMEAVLVQVRTFLYPQRPFKLSDFDAKALSVKAVKLGLVAYAAYVIIDEKNKLASDIIWDRLG